MRIKASVLMLTLVLISGVRTQKSGRAVSKQDEVVTVNFCELAKHPKDYLNRLVRIDVNYIGWWESSYLYGDVCNEDKYKIHNALDCPGDGVCLDCTAAGDRCKKKYEEVWKALAPYSRSDNDNFASRVRGVLIGRLIGPGRFGHLGAFEYEFRIRTVEKGISIPDKSHGNCVGW